MKNIRNSNPVRTARLMIGFVTLMTSLNIILILLQWMPIMPLSLVVPTTFIATASRALPVDMLTIYDTAAKVQTFRLMWGGFGIFLVLIMVYAYFRSLKKPGAIKFALVVILFDTMLLFLDLGFNISVYIQLAYHAFMIYYIYTGIKALKAVHNV